MNSRRWRDPTWCNTSCQTSPTFSATPATRPIHATTPTLLLHHSPRSGRPDCSSFDTGEDSNFQSNAKFSNTVLPGARPTLNGLGITCGELSPTTKSLALLDITNSDQLDHSHPQTTLFNRHTKRPASPDASLSDNDLSPTQFWASATNDSNDVHRTLQWVSHALERFSGARSPLAGSGTLGSPYAHVLPRHAYSPATESSLIKTLTLYDTPDQPNVTGPFVDVNMYHIAASRQGCNVGVNPRDTVGWVDYSPMLDLPAGNQPIKPMQKTNSPSPSPSHTHMTVKEEVAFVEVIQDIVNILSKSVEDDTLQGSCAGDKSTCSMPTPATRTPARISDAQIDPLLRSPSLRGNHHLPTPTVQSPRDTIPNVAHQRQVKISIYDPNYETPVLNAHVGISQDELIARADRYRMRHPGEEVDKQWLMHFAGKLTEHGELLDEFRCYVHGCGQRNKRRDHILVHIGAHIDQRPFQCDICPMRFLRKNECKRHEASHTGSKPYTCMICPEEKCFARQDLLKRHLKRTHSLGKEPGMQRRKRVKLE